MLLVPHRDISSVVPEHIIRDYSLSEGNPNFTDVSKRGENISFVSFNPFHYSDEWLYVKDDTSFFRGRTGSVRCPVILLSGVNAW